MISKSERALSKTIARDPPFETEQLRKSLRAFFDTEYSEVNPRRPIGSFKWGVYIFYDYDGEPIYVGQTKERVSGRIGRHLTNQRTDAVAMSVLDPFEVCEIEVYPLVQFETITKKSPQYDFARSYLNALEHWVHQRAIRESKYSAILNEKDPPEPTLQISPPTPLRGRIVAAEVYKLRSHPDVRIARRAQVVSRLSQTISERDVKTGLRRTLVTQAERLRRLAHDRFIELGGQASVPKGPEDEEGENGPR